jgi:hypothetical protein
MDKKGKPKKEKNFQEVVKEFDRYFHDPDQFYKIFSELGFSYVDDGCNGACDHCEQKDTCETYAEITSKDNKLS